METTPRSEAERPGTWHYTCSACGEKFYDSQRVKAEQKFRDHAEARHKPRAVLTIQAGGDAK